MLWAKDLPLDALIHRFTVGEDPEIDLALVEHDALGSAAHARMLARVGLLARPDAEALVAALAEIAAEGRAGAFTIRPEQEDVHTAIEQALVERLGEAGKRIHLGRSRNDQVILALRLWLRRRVLELGRSCVQLASLLAAFARQHADLPLPGYTHLRRAMPSSFGQWASAFAEGLLEEAQALDGLWQRLDRCPLGAAAGFGVPLPLNREYTAELLGFSRVQRSTIDVQNSRGRHEQAVLDWLSSVAGVLEKWLWDVSLYTMQEFGFLKLPDAYTTGSSIMPQKKNPDVVELARGRCRELRGHAQLHREIASGLPSSYHRDWQLLKRPLIEGVTRAGELLDILCRLVPALEPCPDAAAAACSDELYAAHQAYALVGEGMSFRDAYREVAAQIAEGRFAPNRQALRGSHTGALDGLALDELELDLDRCRTWITDCAAALDRAARRVWSGA